MDQRWHQPRAPTAAARAGHSVTVLLATYTHCIDGQDQITNRQIDRALHPRNPPPDPAVGPPQPAVPRTAVRP